MHVVADAELLVWTTIARALIIANFNEGNRYQQDLVQAAIGASELKKKIGASELKLAS